MFSAAQGRVRARNFSHISKRHIQWHELICINYFSSRFHLSQKYFWSSFIALLLHQSCGARIDSNYASSDRQPRQNVYRGNYKYQVPSYLSPDAYSQTIYSNDHRGSPDGSFGYEYGTDNGIKVKQESTGYGPNKVVRGYYSYVGPDGVTYTVNYVADRFGYRASGAHLPTQPDVFYQQPRPPVYTRPVNNNNPYYVTSTPAPPQVYPLHQNHQHHTQSVYYPQSLPTQHIYVTESVPSNFINITPKPHYSHHVQTSTQLPVNLLPPYSYIPSSPDYSNQHYVWTTAKPPVYSTGFSSTTPRPYVPY